MVLVFINIEKFRHRHSGRTCEDRGRDWSDVAMSPATPETTEEGKVEEGSILEVSEGA